MARVYLCMHTCQLDHDQVIGHWSFAVIGSVHGDKELSLLIKTASPWTVAKASVGHFPRQEDRHQSSRRGEREKYGNVERVKGLKKMSWGSEGGGGWESGYMIIRGETQGSRSQAGYGEIK